MDSKEKQLQGDLNDIIRASCLRRTSDDDWMFLSDPVEFSRVFEQDYTGCSFGDPFSNMRDPFLHQQLDMACDVAVTVNNINNNNNNNNTVGEYDDMMMMPYRNNIILSNMIQISPKANCNLPIISSTTSSRSDHSPKTVKTTSTCAVVEHEHNTGAAAGLQISSPTNNPAPAALKHRRKSQVKKSICIPAPTAPNSRQSGEVVPSDLWAWRKYGQKPIKGSPYPRGYYRCSSSKGCPARKQVERSRTDPKMLVITYSWEHNHPWPTQRNALAGSSRSQPSKNNNIIDNNSSADKTTLPKEEEQESNISDNTNNNDACAVKEEMDDDDNDDGGLSNGSSSAVINNKELLEDLFAKLGEMEAGDDDYADSMMKGLINNNDNNAVESKGLDPFHVFDWSGDNI